MLKIKVKCPYCGFENNIIINPENITEKQITLCDCDKGGCDRYFAAFAKVKVKVQCEGKAIEGC